MKLCKSGKLKETKVRKQEAFNTRNTQRMRYEYFKDKFFMLYQTISLGTHIFFIRSFVYLCF